MRSYVVDLLEQLDGLGLQRKIVEVLDAKLLLPQLTVILHSLLLGLQDVVATVIVIAGDSPIRILNVATENVRFQSLNDPVVIALSVEVGYCSRPL